MQAGFTREPIGHFQGAKETMPGNITSADNSPLRHTVSEKGKCGYSRQHDEKKSVKIF